MSHRTSHQCVAFSLSSERQYSDERYLFHDVFSNQIQISVVTSMHHFMRKRKTSSVTRSHVLQFDFTSYLKSIDHRISIRSFLHSSHRCMISSRRRNLLESFKQYVAEKALKCASLKKFQKFATMTVTFILQQIRVYRVEEVCSKTSDNTSLRKLHR